MRNFPFAFETQQRFPSLFLFSPCIISYIQSWCKTLLTCENFVLRVHLQKKKLLLQILTSIDLNINWHVCSKILPTVPRLCYLCRNESWEIFERNEIVDLQNSTRKITSEYMKTRTSRSVRHEKTQSKIKAQKRETGCAFGPQNISVLVFACNDCRKATEKVECRKTRPSKRTLQNYCNEEGWKMH